MKSQSTIKYSGKVTLKKRKAGTQKTFYQNHNDGRFGLFNFVVYCLYGDYKAPDRPLLVNVYCSKQSSGTPEQKLNFYAQTTTQKNMKIKLASEDSGDEQASIIYTFSLPIANMDIGAFNASGNTYLTRAELLNSNEELCAEVGFGEDDGHGNIVYPEFSRNFDLIIDWELSIGNKQGVIV